MTVVEAVEEIMGSAAAVRLVREMQARLEEEHRRRMEFREWIDEDHLGEFIRGEVVLHSPDRSVHSDVVVQLVYILRDHQLRRGVDGLLRAEKALVSLNRSDFMPDVCWFGPEKTRQIGPDTKVYPAPDLVVEVLSPSTAHRDSGIKWTEYAEAGVGEYWVVDPDHRSLRQFLLEPGTGKYGPAVIVRADGDRPGSLVRCRTIAGLEFPVEALFDEGALREFSQRG